MTDRLKAVCAWCKKVVREGPEPISHTICAECKRKIDEEIDRKEKKP